MGIKSKPLPLKKEYNGQECSLEDGLNMEKQKMDLSIQN